jgi:hypothetical protein
MAPESQHSLMKSLTYQGIVVATDQLLYGTIINGAAASELGFVVANATTTGVAHYVAFGEVWWPVCLGPVIGQGEISVPKRVRASRWRPTWRRSWGRSGRSTLLPCPLKASRWGSGFPHLIERTMGTVTFGCHPVSLSLLLANIRETAPFCALPLEADP